MFASIRHTGGPAGERRSRVVQGDGSAGGEGRGIRRRGPAAGRTRRRAAIVSGEGLKLPGRWPSAIDRGVHPYLSLRFQTSARPPCRRGVARPSGGSCSRAVHGGLAVVVDGVHVVAEFEAELDGLDRLFLGPASSLGEAPTPAAAIRGVLWWAFGSLGSAPCLRRVFIKGTSAVIRPGGTASRRPGRGPPGRRRPLEPRVDVGPVLDQHVDELEAGQVPGADRGRVAALVVAPVRLADPGERMECREARPLVVRVGPGLQQGDGQLKVAVFDGEDQRRGPPPRRGPPAVGAAWPR